MRASWMLAFVASGCGFEVASGGEGKVDAPETDAMIDAAGSKTCPWPYTVPMFQPCPMADSPFDNLDLTEPGEYVYNTEFNTFTSPGGSALTPVSTTDNTTRVLWVKRLRIATGSTLRGVGNLPLIIVAQTDITLDGTVDVGSRMGANSKGAGSDPPACDTNEAGDGRQCMHGGSGGGGGGFGGAGGNGGVGGNTRDCPGQPLGQGIAGGIGGPLSGDASFRGGCDGGEGADGDAPEGGNNGNGGGAIHLIARDRIIVSGSGRVLAGGSGGLGGVMGRSGGGAGGSGGLIMLSGTSVRVDGILAANGGGGGGGTNNGTGATGESGQASATPANGGAGAGGGTGGSGAAGNVAAGVGATADRGGGGGGGGVGKIRITTAMPSGQTISGIVSPPAI